MSLATWVNLADWLAGPLQKLRIRRGLLSDLDWSAGLRELYRPRHHPAANGVRTRLGLNPGNRSPDPATSIMSPSATYLASVANFITRGDCMPGKHPGHTNLWNVLVVLGLPAEGLGNKAGTIPKVGMARMVYNNHINLPAWFTPKRGTCGTDDVGERGQQPSPTPEAWPADIKATRPEAQGVASLPSRRPTSLFTREARAAGMLSLRDAGGRP
jgi:hypothetical protein